MVTSIGQIRFIHVLLVVDVLLVDVVVMEPIHIPISLNHGLPIQEVQEVLILQVTPVLVDLMNAAPIVPNVKLRASSFAQISREGRVVTPLKGLLPYRELMS